MDDEIREMERRIKALEDQGGWPSDEKRHLRRVWERRGAGYAPRGVAHESWCPLAAHRRDDVRFCTCDA